MKKKLTNVFKGKKKNHKKNRILLTIICIVVLLFLSIYSNQKYPFPHFVFFLLVFLFIGFGSFGAVLYYNQTIDAVISLTIKEPPCKRARIIIQKYRNLKINWIIPILVIITFGVGGCAIFSPKRYKNLPIMSSAKVPPVINWYKKLERLFIIYQGAFFLFGLLYIIAFGKFCFSPEYGVYINSIIFYCLWGIIFIAIVLTFPVVVQLEKKWIKKIKDNIIEYYFLESKKEVLFFEQKKGFSELVADAIRRNIIEGVLEKEEREIFSMIFGTYSKTMSVINFIVSIITIFQFCQIDLYALVKLFE